MRAFYKIIGCGTEFISDWFHEPYTILTIANDGAAWVLDYEAQELQKIAKQLGISAKIHRHINLKYRQCIHYTSQFILQEPYKYKTSNRISLDYFHGMPNQGEEFAQVFEAFKKNHQYLHRIRVSNSMIENLLLTTKVEPAKIHRIVISIDTDLFKPKTQEESRLAKIKLGIPEDSLVIGSFQKDGHGWGEGMEPKLIKGPDVFLKVLSLLKEKLPNLHVLLTGPARGYVKKGLSELNIPFTHRYLNKYEEIVPYFQALDLYLVTSREEGGPKAILEAMASGVPLITTKVGQAIDLVRHEENGWMVECGDVEGLAHSAEIILSRSAAYQNILVDARKTAEANSYTAQIPLWKKYFEDYVIN